MTSFSSTRGTSKIYFGYFEPLDDIMGVAYPTRKKLSENPSTNKLLCRAYASILQNAIQKLAVLGTILNLPPVEVNVHGISLDERYGYFEYNEGEACPDPKEAEMVKLQKDRTFIEKVLIATTVDIVKTGTFEELHQILEDFETNRLMEDLCLKNNARMERDLVDMQRSFSSERQEFAGDIQKMSEEVGNLKDEENVTIIEYEAMSNLAQKWEQSRLEQNGIGLGAKENVYVDTIRKFNLSLDQEERIHSEITSFLLQSQQDCMNDIEVWMEKYDSEMEEREIDINQLQQKISRQHEDYVALKELYEKRKQEIIDYELHKEEKRKEAAEMYRKVKAATKIQAWWRGTMFRKCLGPYRKKKGKGKKTGSAKNKKKKT